MYRSIACAIALAFSSASLAQTAYDPQVAYTQVSGNTQYLYVANADGSHAVRVATASNGFIGIDFAPGGGQLAFVDRQGLKLLKFSASNAGVQVLSQQTLVGVANGQPGPPDFSPDGTRILYSAMPNTTYAVSVSGGAPVPLCACAGSNPRWLRSEVGTAFAYMKMVPHGPNVPVDYEIWTALVSSDGTVSTGPVVSTSTQAFKAMEDFDVARTRNSLLITANYPTTIRFLELDLVTGTLRDIAGPGFRGHFSANDSRIVFRNLPYPGSPDLIQSLELATGRLSPLTKKGNYGLVDARP